MDAVREARGALRKGRSAEALVHLWNALEPARLAGDRRRLDAIGGLAAHIAASGEEADRREAERLLEATREAAAEPGAFAGADDVGTASVGGEVEPAHELEPVHELEPFGVEEAGPGPERVEEPDEAEEKRSGVPSIWTILIILFVIITIARNFIEGQ
jgi:hypothetical protein